jgi:TonB family protein
MKNKLKIMDHQPYTSDEEIESFMDFSAVLDKHNQQLKLIKRSAYRRWGMLGSVVVAGVVSSIWFMKYTEQPATPVPLQPAGIDKPQVKPEAMVPLQDNAAVDTTQAIPKAKSQSARKSISNDKSTAAPAQQPLPEALPEIGYVQAEPVKGYPDLYDYLSANLVYPAEALKDSIQGVMTVSFVINKAGHAEKIVVLNSLGPAFDAEVQRLIGGMPAWKPALLNGKPVSSKMSLPVTFQYTGFKRKD